MVKVLVECPNCGRRQNSGIVKSRKCISCGSRFVLINRKENKSRVVEIVEGTYQQYIREVYKVIYDKPIPSL